MGYNLFRGKIVIRDKIDFEKTINLIKDAFSNNAQVFEQCTSLGARAVNLELP